jgi:hypothetical protein
LPDSQHHSKGNHFMSNMQFNKSSTGASPYFGGERHGYAANPGRTNAATPSPAGGEVRRDEIRSNGGSLLRSPRVVDSVRR